MKMFFMIRVFPQWRQSCSVKKKTKNCVIQIEVSMAGTCPTGYVWENSCSCPHAATTHWPCTCCQLSLGAIMGGLKPCMEGQQEADERPWPCCDCPAWKLLKMALKLLECLLFCIICGRVEWDLLGLLLSSHVSASMCLFSRISGPCFTPNISFFLPLKPLPRAVRTQQHPHSTSAFAWVWDRAE